MRTGDGKLASAVETHQLEDGDLHHALLEVRRLVLDDLYRDDLVRLHVLALDDLAERALAEYVEDKVPVVPKSADRKSVV